MTFKEISQSRFSARKYTSKEVSQADTDYIMESARLAPSAVNYQPWRFIIVKSEEYKAKLRKAYDREWFASAPMYIVCISDHSQSWHRKNDGKDHADIDIAIATEHICLAASDLGLGTCWVCNFDSKMVHEDFKLGDSEEACVLIPLGHIAHDCPQKEKQRKGLEEIVTTI